MMRGVVRARVLAVVARLLQAVPWADASEAARRPQGRPVAVLRPAYSPRRAQGFRGLSGAAAQAQVVRLLKAPVWRTQRRARLSVALHAPHPHRQPPTDL